MTARRRVRRFAVATVPARSRVTSLDFAPAAFESGDGRSGSESSVTGRAKARVTLWQLLTCACSVRRKQLFRLPAASIVCRTRALLWLCAFLQCVCCCRTAFDREAHTASAVTACGRFSESAVRASTFAQFEPQRPTAPISNHFGRIRPCRAHPSCLSAHQFRQRWAMNDRRPTAADAPEGKKA